MGNGQAFKVKTSAEKCFFRACTEDFKKIPGGPIAYSASKAIGDLFLHGTLSDFADTRLGMATADNNRFLRFWYEISLYRICFSADSREEAKESKKRWFPYQKGGEYRKWFGNNEYCVNWQDDGDEIQNFKDEESGKIRSHNYNLEHIFKRGVTWNALASGKTSARISNHSLFDNAGSSLFVKTGVSEESIMGLVNSNVMLAVFPLISPTLNYQPGDLSKLPAYFPNELQKELANVVPDLIKKSKLDWNSRETTPDFSSLPLLNADFRQPTLKSSYQNLRAHWRELTLETHRLEEESNRIFIEAYSLQDELTPEVPMDEITLSCNPHYQYGNNKSEEELEALLLADTVRDLVSYAVGCMFGRYALENPGLILANQGETIQNYLKRVPEPIFPPDEDNVIPMLDGDWFTDDITERFREFLRIAFGEEQYEENLRFVEKALGKDIRKYFLKDFYSDHVRCYKKRPIYWLFSSPKGSFNALIYMHRYQPHTVGTVLEYLRDFKDEKLQARKNHLEAVSISSGASQADKTKALKEVEKINKILTELDDYERDVLYPLATEQVPIDLDDGVKFNYPRFGDALKKIPGLS
jgi:type II restriction/modification system DNA methylase subunit YeeA